MKKVTHEEVKRTPSYIVLDITREMNNCCEANCGRRSFTQWLERVLWKFYSSIVLFAGCHNSFSQYMLASLVCETMFFISDNGYRRCSTAEYVFCYPKYLQEIIEGMQTIAAFCLVCIKDNCQLLTTRLLVSDSESCQSQTEKKKLSIKFSFTTFSEMRLLIRIYFICSITLSVT